MTRQQLQLISNDLCVDAYEKAMREYNPNGYHYRLRSCSASVFETEHYYILRSYSTVIAVIDKYTDTLYDVLRYVYGYSATSAQHISKFEKEYCKGKWNCDEKFTYRAV